MCISSLFCYIIYFVVGKMLTTFTFFLFGVYGNNILFYTLYSLGVILNSALYPFVVVYITVLFVNMKIKKEIT